jgi:hypothetical protein
MVAEGLLCRSWPRAAAAAFAILALTVVLAAPAGATPRPVPTLTSTDAMLKWINAYRGRPEPDGLPVLVRALSDLQAFKDAESSGAYVGFIAGVLSANPDHAEVLVARMLPIAPADHWVLVRAIAYSGLPNWREVLATFVDRMPTRRAMIDKYLDGKLPTLDQIIYRPAKPGVLDKIGEVLSINSNGKKEVAIDRSSTCCGASTWRPARTSRSNASSSCCRSPTTRTASTSSPPAAPPNSHSPAMPCATCTCSPCSNSRSRGSPRRTLPCSMT